MMNPVAKINNPFIKHLLRISIVAEKRNIFRP